MQEKEAEYYTIEELLKKTREVFAQVHKEKDDLELKYKKMFFPPSKMKEEHIKKSEVIITWDNLFNFSNEDFINNAYRWLLRRDPDPEGIEYFLNALEKNIMSRVEVLGRLRFSQEGRKHGVYVKGLFFKFVLHLLYKLPLFGYLLNLITSFLNLPYLKKEFQNLTQFVKNNFSLLEKKFKEISSALDNFKIGLENFAQELSEIKKKIINKADLSTLIEIKKEISNKSDLNIIRVHQRILEKIQDDLKKISGKIEYIEKATNSVRPYYLENIKISTESIQEKQLIIPEKLDLMYFRLEENFRGSREQVKEWQKIYLPYINKYCVGTSDSPILDLGCGRGEWLELLKQNDKVAFGVDFNLYMVQLCDSLGLKVYQQEILTFLKEQKENYLGAITGFHLIEHLSFQNMLTLLKESFRVLKSGGILILETPNPENMHIGSWFFYQDPTHLHPIPPNTLEFLVKEEGFNIIEIVRLRPLEIQGLENELLKKMFFGPTEYALIAIKP